MISTLFPKTNNKNEMNHNEHEEQQRTQSCELPGFPLWLIFPWCPLWFKKIKHKEHEKT